MESTERRAWRSMIDRCYNPKNTAYHNYGGRGIKVCDQWIDNFNQFLQDVGLKPDPYLSLERIDNNNDYRPDNVKWATSSEQRCNQRVPTKNKSFIHYLERWMEFY